MLGRNKQLLNAILTALFAAIIYIGISVLRIPLPAIVGRPFIHFGNPLMVIAILFLGGVWGGVAAAVGLGGFDILNGYAATSWLTVLEVIVMAIVVSAIMRAFKHDDRPSHMITIGIAAGVTKLITSFLATVVEGLIAGDDVATGDHRLVSQPNRDSHQLRGHGDYCADSVFLAAAGVSGGSAAVKQLQPFAGSW